MATTWLEQRHPQYAEMSIRNIFAEDHFSGEVYEKALRYALELQTGQMTDAYERPDGTKVYGQSYSNMEDYLKSRVLSGGISDVRLVYLTRRVQGEAVPNYQERARISRFPRIMSFIVHSMAGSIGQVESKAAYTWGDLGDPFEDPESFMADFMEDVDGAGTNYDAWISDVLRRLQVFDNYWLYVEPPPTEDRRTRFVCWHPCDVVNYYYDGQRLKWVLVREQVDMRSDPKADPENESEEHYILYTDAGWERWMLDEKKPVQLDEGLWPDGGFVDLQGNPRLPVIRKGLFAGTHLGYELAKDNNYLYNLLSDSRNIVRIANHPRLKGVDVTTEQLETTEQKMQMGSNVLLGDWSYISPDPSNFERAYAYYMDEAKGVARDAFHMMNDAARERTATEMRQEDQAGRSAYLTHLSRTLDEIENEALFLLGQTQFPNQDFEATAVERSRDFKPIDAEREAHQLADMFFPGGISLPTGIEAGVRQRILDTLNIEYEEEELTAEAEVSALLRDQERAEAEALAEIGA